MDWVGTDWIGLGMTNCYTVVLRLFSHRTLLRFVFFENVPRSPLREKYLVWRRSHRWVFHMGKLPLRWARSFTVCPARCMQDHGLFGSVASFAAHHAAQSKNILPDFFGRHCFYGFRFQKRTLKSNLSGPLCPHPVEVFPCNSADAVRDESAGTIKTPAPSVKRFL